MTLILLSLAAGGVVGLVLGLVGGGGSILAVPLLARVVGLPSAQPPSARPQWGWR